MSDKVFLDTNVLVYCYSSTEHAKQDVAVKIAQNAQAWVSTQVLQELSNILRRKFGKSWKDVQQAIDEVSNNFHVFTNELETIRTAVQLAERYGYSFYDSLILSSSLVIGCSTVFSEDMQHSQVIEGKLEIINPFI